MPAEGRSGETTKIPMKIHGNLCGSLAAWPPLKGADA
jgi:hypothetical protein